MWQRLSWRDPSGFVVREGRRVFRAVASSAVPWADKLLAAEWFQRHVRSGHIPESRWVEHGPADYPGPFEGRWIEHAPLTFAAYPHEISALQLHEAARLTLQLALDALENGWSLKDASAWNVLFDRGRPVFCDLLSFEPWEPSPTWTAYAQFQRCFIIPLLVFRKAGIPPRTWFLRDRDGVTPEAARKILSGVAAWTQPGLEAVTLPALTSGGGKQLHRTASEAPPGKDRNRRARRHFAPDVSKHVLRSTLRRLSRHVESLRPATSKSAWLGYESERDHYSAADLAQKSAFVREALCENTIRTVLDLGSNTGEYSQLAAELGKIVVAVDSDDASLQRLYERTLTSGADITPFVLNIARPPPPLGWMNREVPGFLERARQHFDCVLALGLMHHLVITERAPLAQIAALLAQLSRHTLVVEWIERDDPRFQELAGPNLLLYQSIGREAFEQSLAEYFAVRCVLRLSSGTRTLYRCTLLHRDTTVSAE